MSLNAASRVTLRVIRFLRDNTENCWTRQRQGICAAATSIIFFQPDTSWAADNIPRLSVSAWSALPFLFLLAAIALLPLISGKWWHANRNKAIVSAGCATPAAIYLLCIDRASSGASTHQLREYVEEYAAFIVMLLSLYVISSGILLIGDIPSEPRTNLFFLAVGAVLANLIGTTGASMVLIRPLLRINHSRSRKLHVPIFFIMIVSNTGGLLTPLGDPPLFLGFLSGVSFFWTLTLWRQWLMVNGLLLAAFFFYDRWLFRRETGPRTVGSPRPLQLYGAWHNGALMAGVVVTVLLQSPKIGLAAGQSLGLGNLTLEVPLAQILQLLLVAASWLLTPASVRHGNQFAWSPITEVAVLFLGIFVAMIPALALLREHGGQLNVTHPAQFFWLTGILSAILDNAPTYLTFATLAAGEHSLGWLSENRPEILGAISCGAVFMGAITYIGNGPNFMVKAIADAHGYRMPSIAGYTVYSLIILLPVFVLATALFFR